MHMKHKRTAVAFLAACLTVQSICITPLAVSAENESDADDSEQTETVVTVDKSMSALFLPDSYEQYLPLETPADVAFYENHIAVADGNRLYVFDGTVYREYEHIKENADGIYDSAISKVGFDASGTLYFSDRDLSFYRISFEDLSQSKLSPEETEIKNCSTFCIADTTVFTAAVSGNETTLYAIPLDNVSLSAGRKVDTLNTALTPSMTYLGDTLYCAVNTYVTAYTYQNGGYRPLYDRTLDSTSSVSGLSSLAVLGDSFYYTVKDVPESSGLYQTDLAGHSVLLSKGEGYVALTAFQDALYCVRDRSVKKLIVSDGKAEETGYEITSSSESVNRLNGATETVRAKNIVVTADRANNRISIYDTLQKSYSVIPCKIGEEDYAPEYIATDGEIIAVSFENQVFVYTENESGEYQLTTQCMPRNAVSGLACVYGKCYFVTKGFGYGLASNDFDPASICTRDRTESSAPCALVADLYGNLYVVRADGAVYRYTEESFLDESVLIGDRAEYMLPNDFYSPRADFEGNVYCLSGNNMYKNGELCAMIKAEESVFAADESVPASFALGFEDNTVYFTYGDFIVKTNAIVFPTLDTILTEDTAKRVFAPQTSLTLVSVKENSIAIRTDLDLLKTEESDYFPYSHYYRMPETQRGILLTTTEKYSLVALFGKDHKYTANLFLTEGYVTEVPREEYWEDSSGSAYLSSDVSLSLFPCLVPALRGDRLNRLNKISVLGIVSSGETADYEYALVRYEADDTVCEGYVPLSYLTHAAPVGNTDDYRLAYLKEKNEGALFISEDGTTLTLTERTQIAVYQAEDGYTAKYTKDGVDYYAHVTDDDLETPANNALRIALIVILTVVGVLIVGNYFFLRPIRRKNKKSENRP